MLETHRSWEAGLRAIERENQEDEVADEAICHEARGDSRRPRPAANRCECPKSEVIRVRWGWLPRHMGNAPKGGDGYDVQNAKLPCGAKMHEDVVGCKDEHEAEENDQNRLLLEPDDEALMPGREHRRLGGRRRVGHFVGAAKF